MAAENLKLLDEYIISGYKPEEWITDIRGKLDVVSKKDEERKLQVLENKLQKMLSDDKKIELELEEIAKSLE
jgi:DNA-binding transcriptional regulator YhcF (GntR family)